MRGWWKKIKQIANLIISDPLGMANHIRNRIYVLWLSRKHNIEIKGKLIINGYPLIDLRNGGKLYLGDEVTLNSRNKGYHINMHSPVKLFADRPGAMIRIGGKTRIHGTCIHACQLVEIGCNCLIAANCQIFDGNGHNVSFLDVEKRIQTTGDIKPIKIGDNVWLGANSFVLPGVTIGEGSVISANSVVVKDIPAMVVAGGNPAKIIKSLH